MAGVAERAGEGGEADARAADCALVDGVAGGEGVGVVLGGRREGLQDGEGDSVFGAAARVE